MNGLPAAWVNETTTRNKQVAKMMAMLSRGAKRRPVAASQIVVKVSNTSGADRNAGEILGVGGIVLPNPTSTPTDPQTSNFFYDPILNGAEPTTADDFGNFVVCLEPIANNAVGRAVISGLCAVQVNLINNSDGFADVTNNDSTQLTSGPIGSASIVVVPGSGTGKQLVLAIVGCPTNMSVPVKLSQNGGSAGTNGSATCTFTYDAEPLGGGTKWNSSALTPANSAIRIANLQYGAATLGWAYIDGGNSNALAIDTRNESPSEFNGCS